VFDVCGGIETQLSGCKMKESNKVIACEILETVNAYSKSGFQFPFNIVMLNSTIRVDKIEAGIQSCHTQTQSLCIFFYSSLNQTSMKEFNDACSPANLKAAANLYFFWISWFGRSML
jgi:hypothetical protein